VPGHQDRGSWLDFVRTVDTNRTKAGVWRLLLLLEVAGLHLFLFCVISNPTGPLGAGDRMTHAGGGLACTHVLLAIVAAICGTLGRRQVARGYGTLAAIVPLPAYLLAFGSDWGLCLVGILTCCMHGRRALAQAGEPARPSLTPLSARQPLWPALAQAMQTAEFTASLLLALAAGLIVVLAMAGHGLARTPLPAATGWTLILLAAVTGFFWRRVNLPTPTALNKFELVVLIAAVACWVWPQQRGPVMTLFALYLSLVLWRVWTVRYGARAFWDYLVERPAHLLAFSFAVLVLAGTLLLGLPQASTIQGGLSFIDALFTATSATCVTGLIVVDTGLELSVFGQVVVLVLIQLGGLGIMTISAFFALILGRNIGLRGEFALREMIGERKTATALRLIRFIVLCTVVIEVIGTLILAWEFHSPDCPWNRSLYLGVFHSISAFCNAGFSLFSDSLCGFSGPAIKPIGLRFITELAQNPDLALPLSGVGGIETWIDALEYILCGSSTVQIATGVMHYGYRIVEDILEGLSYYMAARGYGTVEEMVGRALPNIHETEKFDLSKQGVAEYDLDRCIGCGQCYIVCRDAGGQCLAWNGRKRIPEIDEKQCLGCMLCSFVCPVDGMITHRYVKNKKHVRPPVCR